MKVVSLIFLVAVSAFASPEGAGDSQNISWGGVGDSKNIEILGAGDSFCADIQGAGDS